MVASPTLLWLRQDLRLADNPALSFAVEGGGTVLPVYILDDDAALGGASRWWLHRSLAALAASLAERGGRLLLRRGRAEQELPRLAAETGARLVVWNRRWEPAERAREARVAAALAGVETRDFPGNLLFEPGSVTSQAGRPFSIFTAFWRAAQQLPEPARPLPAPPRVPCPEPFPSDLPLETLGLFPERDWWQGLDTAWRPGEGAAVARLAEFVANDLERYALLRDNPDQPGTSRLSPHLAFGEVSPRQLWHAARSGGSAGEETFLRELGWREFSYHLLAAHPSLAEQPLRPEFADFPWEADEALFRAWAHGRTGFPTVDAGMRQLRATGWMHNRVRMIVGSFLVKDLLTPWQRGLAWFRDNLVDHDLAANAASWQWIAGCGTDSAPYFRVFNPVLQGEKFDPRGRYVRRWVPELAGLSDFYIHHPWEAPPAALAQAGIILGSTYPRPVLDHGAARRRALGAYNRIRAAG